MYSLLFVDDDPDILRINRDYFEPRDYAVSTATAVDDALSLLQSHTFDCIILDVILPNSTDGYRLCRQIRNSVDTPIIFLTSLSGQDFLYQGFECGGDDFMTKPYDLRELQARIDARIRQHICPHRNSNILRFPPLAIDLVDRRATIHNELLSLTSGEFDILTLLASHPQQTFSPDEIYSQIWQLPGLSNTHTVQVHVSHLRHKLEAACPNHCFIQTVWGKGYLFIPPSPAVP